MTGLWSSRRPLSSPLKCRSLVRRRMSVSALLLPGPGPSRVLTLLMVRVMSSSLFPSTLPLCTLTNRNPTCCLPN